MIHDWLWLKIRHWYRTAHTPTKAALGLVLALVLLGGVLVIHVLIR